MTKKQLLQTPWRKNLRKNVKSKSDYDEAISFALKDSCEVEIIKTTDRGWVEWAIMIPDSNGFWMDAKNLKKEALALCKEMGWKIIPIVLLFLATPSFAEQENRNFCIYSEKQRIIRTRTLSHFPSYVLGRSIGNKLVACTEICSVRNCPDTTFDDKQDMGEVFNTFFLFGEEQSGL